MVTIYMQIMRGGSNSITIFLSKQSNIEHIGLKVVIQDAKPECLKIKSLENALSRWFGLLLRRKKVMIEIIDVDNSNKVVQVKAPDNLDTHGERTDSSLEMSRGGNIRVNLVETDAPSLTPNIDVYQKEIYVCSLKLPYLTKGYVIYNGLELVPKTLRIALSSQLNLVSISQHISKLKIFQNNPS